ncbi:MAG: sigma-70 family RNA polymerase sigma factor [Kiritimatiellae bacterium]|nr:sigma-70 family RNA polymerase sigma factor [Kiritimatiellia bacterium]
MSSFPVTSVTLIQKIKTLSPGNDSAAWVRFWDTYSLAIRQFAALKGGEANADDIVMTVLGKLVEVLRSGQYTPDKGAFHSYLATMIVNEIHMQHRKDLVRKADQHLSLDAPVGGEDGGGDATLADTLQAPATPVDAYEEDWRQAILASAVEHVLTKTALSDRDRAVYRAYVQEGRPISEVAAEFKLSRNSVSQIKSRIDKRIVAVGRELVAGVK